MKEDFIKKSAIKDRFEKLANNYSNLFHEVFQVQGFDYDQLQKTVFDEVVKEFPDFKNEAILDIGIGDGETAKFFIENGCIKVTGIDLNPEMLKQAKDRFGDKIKLLQADATNLSMFSENNFPIIVSGMSIHNIDRINRISFWNEIKRIKPKLLVLVEKIFDLNNIKYQTAYNKEILAIDKIFDKKYKMPEIAHEWIKHYQDDQREKLEIKEIVDNLGSRYEIKVVFEMGLYKTITCKKVEETQNK
jgi:ubiquinone/menaquinone biosynthesis C-methylase UbiE